MHQSHTLATTYTTMAALSTISFAIASSLVLLYAILVHHHTPPHIIKFRSPNLFPESLAWDPSSHRFILGSFNNRSFHSVSSSGVVSTLLSDPSLPPNTTILGLAVDPLRHRLLAAVTTSIINPDHDPFNALAAYDLNSLTPLFLSLLTTNSTSSSPDVANDVTVDESSGAAYVTNSGNNFIWKVNVAGQPSVFSKSHLFTKYQPLDPAYAYCGINGIHYVAAEDDDGGYLLVTQTSTGKLFKVDAGDGTARVVVLGEDMYVADGITVRPDGAAVVVSPVAGVRWVVKSDDGFREGWVVEKVGVDKGGFPTAVTVGGGGRVYLLYGYVVEGMMGNLGREWFRIEEVRGSEEDRYQNVLVFVLICLGLVCFLGWRLWLGRLV